MVHYRLNHLRIVHYRLNHLRIVNHRLNHRRMVNHHLNRLKNGYGATLVLMRFMKALVMYSLIFRMPLCKAMKGF